MKLLNPDEITSLSLKIQTQIRKREGFSKWRLQLSDSQYFPSRAFYAGCDYGIEQTVKISLQREKNMEEELTLAKDELLNGLKKELEEEKNKYKEINNIFEKLQAGVSLQELRKLSRDEVDLLCVHLRANNYRLYNELKKLKRKVKKI